MVTDEAADSICLALLTVGCINIGVFTAGLLGMQVKEC